MYLKISLWIGRLGHHIFRATKMCLSLKTTTCLFKAKSCLLSPHVYHTFFNGTIHLRQENLVLPVQLSVVKVCKFYLNIHFIFRVGAKSSADVPQHSSLTSASCRSGPRSCVLTVANPENFENWFEHIWIPNL